MSDDKHPDFEKLGPGEAVAGMALGAVFGVFVGVIVSAATYSNKVANPSLGSTVLTWVFICGGIGLILGLISFSVNASRHARYKSDLQKQAAERERARERQLEQARAHYATAYAEYLPKWQAWLLDYRRYTTELRDYGTWEAEHKAAWQGFHSRVIAAVEAFKILHLNVDKRAQLELELTSPNQRAALFREAFAEAAKQHKDFGLLRLTESDPALAARIPELLALRADPALAIVNAILPPLPSFPATLRDVRQKPVDPTRPEAPGGIIFYSNGGREAAPVKPEHVKFNRNHPA